mgnify:CR=1 FL=1
MSLTYPDDDQLEVCEFDIVSFQPDNGTLRGQGEVTKIYPRKKAVRVKYENPSWRRKITYKQEVVPVSNIHLIERSQ